MMSEAAIVSLAAVMCAAIIALTMLRGWENWLSLRRDLAQRGDSAYDDKRAGHYHAGACNVGAYHRDTYAGIGEQVPVAAQIELADLRERIRKLEAIANGIEP